MKDGQPYPSGRAVEHAIKEAARNETPRVRARALEAAVRDRFLCRVFTGASDRWALKGGTGMLARVPQARSTRDVDLFARESSIDEAVSELAKAAGIDLADHFRFTLGGKKAISASDEQPYVEGARVEFEVRIGAKDYPALSVDLVVGPSATQPFETLEPAADSSFRGYTLSLISFTR